MFRYYLFWFYLCFIVSFASGQHLLNSVELQKSLIDTTIDPKSNFYQFANGKWLRAVHLSNGNDVYAPYITLYQSNEKFIDSVVKSLGVVSANEATPSFYNLQRFYQSAIDSDKAFQTCEQLLRQYIKAIRELKHNDEIPKFCASHLYIPTRHLLNLSLGEYEGKYEAQLLGSGTNLFKSDQNDPDQIRKKNAYLSYLQSILEKVGYTKPIAHQNAQGVFTIESGLFGPKQQAQRSQSDLYSLAGLTRFEQLKLKIFFKTLQLNTKTVRIRDVNYYLKLDSCLKVYPLEYWKAKLIVDYIIYNSWALPELYQQLYFSFKKETTGQVPISSNWNQQLSNYIKSNLKEFLYKTYSKNKFSSRAKNEINEVFRNIKQEFRKRLISNAWLSKEAKRGALKKLNAMVANIAYPNHWSKILDIHFSKENFARNTVLIYETNKRLLLGKIGHQKDRTTWTFPVFGIGQSYNNAANVFTLAAGFLQPPYYLVNQDKAILYGIIGTTIGHEMTHGFDQTGRLYNFDGVRVKWWTEKDSLKFELLTKPIVEQFNKIKVLDILNIDGQSTLGENLADIGSLTLAYSAFQRTADFKKKSLIDNYSPAQRFFIAYAQKGRDKMGTDAFRAQLKQVWPPAEIRVNESLKNFEPFYKAFSITQRDSMYKSEPITVW